LAKWPNKWRAQFLRLICRNSQAIENREVGLINVSKKGGAMSFSGLRCSGANNPQNTCLAGSLPFTGKPEVNFCKVG
jgi:hypothetical protein